MNRFLILSAIGLLVSQLEVQAAAWKGACDISFQVTETMNRKFSGTGQAEAFAVEVTGEGEQQTASWKVALQPAKLSTGKAGRDEEMHKMFRPAEFTVATGEVKNFDLGHLGQAADGKAALPFTLSILGVSHDLTAAVSNIKEQAGQVSFDADFTVDMKSFTLKPKVLLGLFKVANEVPVHATFTLAR